MRLNVLFFERFQPESTLILLLFSIVSYFLFLHSYLLTAKIPAEVRFI